jgi:hypothetical protein
MRYVHKERQSPPQLGFTGTNKTYSMSSSLASGPTSALAAAFQSRLLELPAKHYAGGFLATTTVGYPSYIGCDEISYVNGQRDKFNPCTHVHSELVQLGYGTIVRHYSKTYTYYEIPFAKLYSGINTINVLTNHHYRGDLLTARVRAWKTMQPRIEGEMELLNFLFELADVKQLLSHAYELIFKLRSAVRHFKWKKKKPSLSLTVSNLGLEYNLAISPMIMDLQAIWVNIAEALDTLQDKFINDGQHSNTRHYSEILFDEDLRTQGRNNSYYIKTGRRNLTIFNATLDFKYAYKRRSRVDFAKRFWNLNLTPEVFWNAIPFSFVVDYFVKIGKAIHYMSRDENLDMNVLEYGESVKSESTSAIHVVPGYDQSILLIDNAPSNGGLISGCRSVIYNRYPTEPQKIGAYAPKLNKLKDKQLFNILALVRTAFR